MSILVLHYSIPRMLWGCLQFVIVVFPDHTHLIFLSHVMDCLGDQIEQHTIQYSKINRHVDA